VIPASTAFSAGPEMQPKLPVNLHQRPPGDLRTAKHAGEITPRIHSPLARIAWTCEAGSPGPW
jgi:hypothetical protein